MGKQASSVTPVDLVIVIDTSPSMKDEAQALSSAATSAITKAKSSCPSDLRVVWLGIEGVWKGTNFNQTVRAYLTQKCKAPESKLRSRKRGELKSSGAQEDAARAIEDISTYFDWRKGAARAIFYLGDEALEGGGGKTEQKDIQAANLAIKKAQEAKITIHTYFGTSQSKNQEGIKTEYARLATSTGGRAFTNQDSINGFSTVLEKVICGSNMTKDIKLQAGAVYVQDCITNELSKLYTLDLTTGKTTLIGEIATEVSDIAFVDSELYGLDREGDKTKLVKIDINSGNATTIGDIGFAAAGLAYNRHRHTLYATTAKQLIAINLETGKGTQAVTVANKDYNCGEVAFDVEGKAYITLIGYDKKKILASCNLNTGKVKNIGDIGFPGVASIEFVGDVLYGVTGNFFNLGKDGQLIRIDTNTGKGTLVATTDPAARWAGISIYQPATVVSPEDTTGVTSPGKEVNPGVTSPGKVTEGDKVVTEVGMSILTIDTKNNCYVINADQMNNLQQNVATSFALEKGTFDIKITEGRYSYAQDRTEGEPFVLLWIYGVDGSRFINKNTDFEVGATWTTLNGYNDSLKLEVKEKAVLNALFFDFNNDDNTGSVSISITSDKPFFNPQTLTVDSKRNCYILDENHLSTLKESTVNFVELQPGTYRLKIREGNASYWSNEKKFNIEPWALILVQGGKFSTNLTGIEVGETWISLNGLKDEVMLQVKEKTTLTGLFFDTFKDDNEGKIIIAIAPIDATGLIDKQPQQGSAKVTEQKGETFSSSSVTTFTSGSVTSITTGNTSTNEGAGSFGVVGGRPEPRPSGGSIDFTFRFNEEEFKKKWEEQLKQLDTTLSIVDEVDVTLEAKYWDQLEQWLLKNYEKHFKNLAVEIAKVRFSMDAYLQQIEFSLNQHLQGWSGYLDTFVDDKITVEISKRISQQITQYVDQTFEQRIRNNINLIINSIVNKQELNQYIDRHVDQQIDQNLEQKIRNNITLIINNLVNKQELNQYIDRQVNQQINQSFEQTVRNNIKLLVQNLVNNNTELNQYVSQQIDQNFAQNLTKNINLVTQNLVNNNTVLNQYVSQQVNNSFEQTVNKNVSLITQKITNNNTALNQYVTQQIDNSFEQVINKNVNLITQKITNDNKVFNQYFTQQIDNSFEQVINKNITLLTQKITNDNKVFNQYFTQRIDNSFEQIINKNINLITQKITNDNKVLNQYVTQQIDNSFEQVINKNVNLIAQKITNNNTTVNQYVTQQIDNSFEQVINKNVNLITQKIVNDNTVLNQYVTQHIDNSFEQVVNKNVNLLTQKITNNNTVLNQYVTQQVSNSFEQIINKNVNLITQKIVTNNDVLNLYVNQQIDNYFEQAVTKNISLLVQAIINNTDITQYFDQRIDNSFEQKIQNHVQRITQLIINDNDVFNSFIDQRVQVTVKNNTEVNNNIMNIVNNSTEINQKIENIRHEWNESFISLVTQKVDQLIAILGGQEAFIKLITQNVVNHNTDIDQYISNQIDISYEQKIQNYVKLITQNIINDNDVLNKYVDQRVQYSVTNNNVVINQIFDNALIVQKLENILVDNSQVHQKIENVVINSTEINNRILNFVVNSTEINTKISNVYKDIDIKIANVRNEWNQAFISLVRQYVDEVIAIIGDRESFNIQIANAINIKVEELVNQVLRIRNELTVIINNSDRQLYEWTLGELMAIKGCLTDRQALVEQLITFSSELRVKLDSTNCVDINSFKPFKPVSTPVQLSPAQQQQLPGSK